MQPCLKFEPFGSMLEVVELDELFTFVGSKKASLRMKQESGELEDRVAADLLEVVLAKSVSGEEESTVAAL